MTGWAKLALCGAAWSAFMWAAFAADPPESSTPGSDLKIDIPLAPTAGLPITAGLPPLVLTPPAVKAEPVTQGPTRPPVVAQAVEDPKAVEAAKVPVREQVPLPKAPVEVPPVNQPSLVSTSPSAAAAAPPVVAQPVSRVVVPKPALSEIIMEGPKTQDATVALAAALSEARAAYAKVRDYTGHLIVQERLQGKLEPEATAEIRVRTSPVSMALKFIAPTALVGREIVFVAGRHGNKARVKAAGTYGPLAFANLQTSDPRALVTSRHTVHDVGIGAILERVERSLAAERKLRNPVFVTAADYTFAGKTVTRFAIDFPQPHGLQLAAKLVVCFDPETRLPVRLELHDASGGESSLREAFSLVNLNFNQGIGDGAFDR